MTKNSNIPTNGVGKEDILAMQHALREAALAAAEEEPPIGAVLMCAGEVVAAAHNHREFKNDVTSHAELEVLRAAGAKRGDWRMSDCTLYITLEPCPMCAGAIIAARMGRVVFGAKDPTMGAMGSVLNLPRYPLGPKPVVIGGVMEAECREILQRFFRERRAKK